jgi:MFS transporter, FHS family, L-fucose permease
MNPPAHRVHAGGSYRSALVALTVLFFMWGLITSLNDILIPHLKELFTLSYFQVMMVQFCFFMAYFVMSFPAGFVVERVGYKKGILLGLSIACVGCLMFYPAAGQKSYPLFLAALFIMAAGITFLQVAANPFVTALGSPETASSRLNLTQAFNALGTTVGPALGASFILAVTHHASGETADPTAQASAVQTSYLGLAAVLIAIFAFIALFRLPAGQAQSETAGQDALPQRASIWKYPHLVLGALGIFSYVGAEVSIGSLLVSVMGDPRIASLPAEQAGHYLSIYWGAAMVGRFIGGWLMRMVPAAKLLAANALINVVLIAIAVLVLGHVAMWTLLAIGLFNSIMFPTIFSLAVARLGRFTSEGSGVLCTAIVGGAVMPLVQGLGADTMGLMPSFVIPAVLYFYIAWYGISGHRPR